MSTATARRLITAEEFWTRYADKPGVELVNGRIVRNLMPTGTSHGGIETTIAATLLGYAKKKKLGRVACGEVAVRLRQDPGTIRGADILFISYKRLPKERPLPSGPLEVAPELVVEVRSPTDRLKAIREKTEHYLAAGVIAVMVVDPETESVAIFRDEELPQRFHNGDKITLPDVLPGFSVPAKTFFE